MKNKILALAFFNCAIAISSAQNVAEQQTKAPKAEEVIEAQTPLEKQALRMFKAIAPLPEILAEIEDTASLRAAEVKIEGLLRRFQKEEAALLKLEIPDQATRQKLHAKMKGKVDDLGTRLMGVLMGQMNLPREISSKIELMMNDFEKRISEAKVTDLYFGLKQEKKKN